MPDLVLFKTRETPVRWKSVLPGFVLTAGMANTIDIRLQNKPTSGDNVPMSEASMDISIRSMPNIEKVVLDFGNIPIDTKEEVVSYPVILDVPANVKRGYYRLHLVGRDIDGKPTAVYNAWVAVDRAVDPQADNYMELGSVRSQFADLCGEDNRLLDGLELGTGDIIEAVERCIQQWNSTAPRVSMYTGDSFPYPELLRNGVLSMLLQSVCTLLDRNAGMIAGEGLNIDLEARSAAYKQLRAEYSALWRGGMMQCKNEENAMSFINHLSY